MPGATMMRSPHSTASSNWSQRCRRLMSTYGLRADRAETRRGRAGFLRGRGQVNAYYGLAEAPEGMYDLPGAIGAMRTYLHVAPAGDQYRRKAEAAIGEWQEALKKPGRKNRVVNRPGLRPERSAISGLQTAQANVALRARSNAMACSLLDYSARHIYLMLASPDETVVPTKYKPDDGSISPQQRCSSPEAA